LKTDSCDFSVAWINNWSFSIPSSWSPTPRVFLLFEGKKVAKGKDKTKEEKLRPSDDELRDAICEILKEVDFNTVS
jgi:hypothetical protein